MIGIVIALMIFAIIGLCWGYSVVAAHEDDDDDETK